MLYKDGRQALLRAAAAAVAENGIEGVTTREVCARAGVTAPTLYHHFGSREGLLEQLLQDAQDRYLAGKDDITVTGDPAGDTRNGWDHHIAFARSNAQLYPLLLRPGSDAAESALATLRAGFEHFEQDGVLRPGITPALATIVLSSALRGIALRISRAPDDAELLRASALLREAVVGGLFTTETTRSRR